MFGRHRDTNSNAMHLTFDEAADAVYVYFSREEVDRTEELTDQVIVDYDANGKPVGVEFLDVSAGIELDNVPRRDEVAKLLSDRDFPIYA